MCVCAYVSLLCVYILLQTNSKTNYFTQQYGLGANRITSIFTENDLEVPVDKSSTSQQCLPIQQGQPHPGLCWQERGQQAKGTHSSPMDTCEITSGVLCPVLSSSLQKWPQRTGASPAKSDHSAQGAGEGEVSGEARRAGLVQPQGERGLMGNIIALCNCLMWKHREDRGKFFFEMSRRRMKGNKHSWNSTNSHSIKKSFTLTMVKHWEGPRESVIPRYLEILKNWLCITLSCLL